MIVHWQYKLLQVENTDLACVRSSQIQLLASGSRVFFLDFSWTWSPADALEIALKGVTVGDLYPGSLIFDSSFFKRADETKLFKPVHSGSVLILRDLIDYGIAIKFDVVLFADIDTLIAEAEHASIEFLFCRFRDVVQFGVIRAATPTEKQGKEEKIPSMTSDYGRTLRIQKKYAKLGVKVSGADMIIAGSDLGITYLMMPGLA